MKKTNILDKLGKKSITPDDLAKEVEENLELLPEIFEGIYSTNANIKFGCAKILRTISQKNPKELYPKIDFFIDLLDSTNNIFKWNAIDVLSNLSGVDTEKKFEKVFQKFYGLLSDESMVTAAHVIDNFGKIATAKPHLTQKITKELLNIEKISRNQECMNILLGKAILAFSIYFDQIDNKDVVISFVKRRLNSTRNATRVKAEKFLKKYNV